MEPVESAHRILAAARRVVVLTGAGISTASGIPDFRGPEGVWTKDPHAEMLSTYDTWLHRSDVRERAWRARLARRHEVIEPNDGHRALVELERRGVLHLLVTQNIDGLHQRAGSSPNLVVEIHGSSRDVVCLRCADRFPIEDLYPRLESGDLDPSCQREIAGEVCGGLLKSAVISFGQPLVPADLQRAERAASECDVLVCVGSTLAVYPAAGLVPLAARRGARVVIVNAQPTEWDHVADVVVRDDITVALPEVVRT